MDWNRTCSYQRQATKGTRSRWTTDGDARQGLDLLHRMGFDLVTHETCGDATDVAPAGSGNVTTKHGREPSPYPPIRSSLVFRVRRFLILRV